jgi:sigma-B regulation protein RsbU (phosphoserine phosphatase)
MSTAANHDLIDRLLGLAGFRGEAGEAFRALRDHVARDWPDITVAMLYTLEHDPLAARLAGLIARDGTELMRGQDADARAVRLPRFDDALALACCERTEAAIVDVAPADRGSGFAQALLAPAALVSLPMEVPRRKHGYRLVLASTLRHRFDGIDLAALWRDTRLAFAVLAAGFSERVAELQHREIEGLADIQRLLQPQGPVIRGLDFAVHWQPAATAAGDYFDLMPLSHIFDDFTDTGADAWGVMVCDVSGHGAAAAMEAVQFDAILRTYRGDEPPLGPAGALTYANRHFFSRRQRPHFMTGLGAGGRPDQQSLMYVNAGHLPAIRRRGDAIDWLGRDDDAGIPLGILRDHRWDNHEIDWRRGDVLVVYTDGIVEARDRRGHQFGMQRIAELTQSGDDAPAAVMARIRDAVIEHQDDPAGLDDQTLIVLRQDA